MPWTAILRDLLGVDPGSWALGFSRALPAILLVPAFGLRALALPVRLAFALLLGASVAPALGPVPIGPHPWPLLLVQQALHGLPVALVAATALWAATMTGGVLDDLRASGQRAAGLEDAATPLGVVLSLLTAIAFLQTGGAARVAAALCRPEPAVLGPLTRATFDLAAGVELAVAVAAPVLVVAVVVDVGAGLLVRASGSELLGAAVAPLRALLVLGAAALLLDRMLALLVLASRHAL